MKRSKQRVPAAQTGDAASDGQGQSIAWVNKGGRNATTEQSRRGAGQLAPRPSGGAALPGNDRPSHPQQAGLARVRNAGSSAGGSFTPVQNNALANLQGSGAGYGGGGTPPAPRGGPSQLRAGGRNQAWPNGPLYTDASKKGGSGRGGELKKPARRGKGAAFYGEYPS